MRPELPHHPAPIPEKTACQKTHQSFRNVKPQLSPVGRFWCALRGRPGTACLCAEGANAACMHTAQMNGKRPGGTGHGPNGRISPRLESPSSPCGWEPRHAAHGSRIPPPRTDQKTSSTKHTLPRISLKLGGQSGVPRGSQGSERLLGWVARPSNPLRRRQPAGTEGCCRHGRQTISLQFM